MTEIESLLAVARGRNADYSPSFTERIGGLRARLSAQLGGPIHHDPRMNYRVCQMLELYLGAGGLVPSEAEATELVKVAVSSRVAAWTILAFRRGDGPREWRPMSFEEAWNRLGPSMCASVVEVMDAAGLELIDESSLAGLVPGVATELDGAPATVKEYLFCELC